MIHSYVNAAVFICLDAHLPCAEFETGETGCPLWRLVLLAILTLLVLRLLWAMAWSLLIPSLDSPKKIAFTGYFDPIGIGTLCGCNITLITHRTSHLGRAPATQDSAVARMKIGQGFGPRPTFGYQ